MKKHISIWFYNTLCYFSRSERTLSDILDHVTPNQLTGHAAPCVPESRDVLQDGGQEEVKRGSGQLNEISRSQGAQVPALLLKHGVDSSRTTAQQAQLDLNPYF